MAGIKINPAGVMGSSSMAESAMRVVGTVSTGISTVKWGMDSRILSRYEIGTRLGNIQSTLLKLKGDIQKLHSTVNNGAVLYAGAENRIVVMGREIINDVTVKKRGGNALLFGFGVAVSGFGEGTGLFPGGGGNFGGGGGGRRFGNELADDRRTAVSDSGSGGGGGSSWGSDRAVKNNSFEWKLERKGSVSAWSSGLDEEKDGWHPDLPTAEYTVSIKPEVGVWKVEDYESKIKKKSESEDSGFPEREVSIAGITTKAVTEVNEYEVELTGSGKYGEYNLNVKYGTTEVHNEVSAGIYTFDVNGVTLAAPAINAKMGASYSALSVTADGRLGLGDGHAILGVYGESGIGINKVSIETKAGLSLFNEGGRIDPNGYLELSGENLLFEAKETIGLSVLGMDAGITAGVNFGVGAHAKVGFQDGMFKLDVGASLGIGAKLGFEVDVGGMVDTVCGTVEDAWSGVEKAWEGVEDAWNGFLSWFE